MQTKHALYLSVALSVFTIAAEAQSPTRVWKVGGVGGLPSVQSAVDAASDGDLILVRSGTYPAFVAIDKAVTVLPAQNAVVTLDGKCRAEYLAAGKTLVLGNLTFMTSAAPTAQPVLQLRYNAGAVLLRNASFLGPYGYSTPSAARLLDNGIVVADACEFRGGAAPFYLYDGGTGLTARRSNVASFRSTYTGGAGGSVVNCNAFHYGFDGGDGGDGYVCPEGFLFDSAGTYTGGRGGEPGPDDFDPWTGTWTPAGTGGDGGSGILLGSEPPSALTPRAELLATTASGGLPGGFLGGCGYVGTGGSPIRVNNGSSGTLNGAPREITLQSLAHEATLIPFTARGASGERVYLTFAEAGEFQFDATLLGCRLLRQPTLSTLRPIGTVPASGILQTQIPMRALLPADETRTYLVQAVFVAANGAAQWSNATAIAIVDVAVPLN